MPAFSPPGGNRFCWLVVLITPFLGPSPTLSLESEILLPRAVLFHPIGASSNVLAISTDREIVLVDTGMSPRIAQEISLALPEYFGNLPVHYVINTHAHWDHVQGNQSFPWALIIGHENCRRTMLARRDRDRHSDTPAEAGNQTALYLHPADEQSDSLTAEVPLPGPSGSRTGIPPPPPSLILVDGVNGYVNTPPALTFSDRLELHLEDLTIRLIYFGQAHSRGDILVHVPELGVLSVGDLFLPGNLPTFLAKTPWHDHEWLAALDTVLDPEEPLRYVVPGHGPAIDPSELQAQIAFIRGLRAEVMEHQEIGTTLTEFLDGFDLDRSFPALAGFDVTSHGGGTLTAGILKSAWQTVLEDSSLR